MFLDSVNAMARMMRSPRDRFGLQCKRERGLEIDIFRGLPWGLLGCKVMALEL